MILLHLCQEPCKYTQSGTILNICGFATTLTHVSHNQVGDDITSLHVTLQVSYIFATNEICDSLPSKLIITKFTDKYIYFMVEKS